MALLCESANLGEGILRLSGLLGREEDGGNGNIKIHSDSEIANLEFLCASIKGE